MKSFVLVLSLLISLSFQSCLNVDFKQLLQDASVHFPQKDGILILTTETIDEAIKVHPRLAILFFAPWCPHCKALYPEMAEALKNPELKKMGVVFGRVDIEYNSKVQEDYQIHGMPTVIYFENGAKKEVFGGGRTADKIVEWFYKRLVSKTHKLETLEEIKAYEKPREDFKERSKIKAQSTAELLGISEPNVTYKKPLPVDTINKFFGVVGSQNDAEIIEKQNFEKNYEKFWQFLESNELDFVEKKPGDFNESNMAYWGVQHEPQELHPELKFDPIPGYMGTTRAIVSENIFGMTYKNSLRNADELVKQINQNKAEQLYKSSQSLGPFKKSY